MMKKVRLIALYLPQFHPVAENDKYWGKGFTEWRNVAKAKPLFHNHYQPRLPADLGFYDLRIGDVREQQAEMAKSHGIEGFCYWHYWFGNGKMILERPLEEVVKSQKPNFPFCVGWANHSWSNKTWEKTKHFTRTVTFLEQLYPGIEDLTNHFMYLLPMFKDERYIKVDGKPLFMVFNPFEIPNNNEMIELWNSLARKYGLQGIHFVARAETATVGSRKEIILKGIEENAREKQCFDWGYDAVYAVPVQKIKVMDSSRIDLIFDKIALKLRLPKRVEKHNYKSVLKYLFNSNSYNDNIYPMLIPHWDNTPRAGNKGYVYIGESPKLFGKSVDLAIDVVKKKPEEKRIVFIHSWNEWGEGAYLEPDLKYGMQYLEEIRKRIM